MHHRSTPRRHLLRYRMFSVLVDLDELAALSGRLRLFSHNRFNFFSFHDRDHGGSAREALRPWVERHLREAGIVTAGGAIRLLCMPRILGHVFNPLSVFFCHARDGALVAILYEVNNTFGERHSYLIPAIESHGSVTQACAKALYVSPFVEMGVRYRFSIVPPGEAVVIAIEVSNQTDSVMTARFGGRRLPFTDRALLAAFSRAPLQWLSVLAGIHWEALKLWRKGLRVHEHPSPPAHAVTIVAAGAE